MSTIIDFIYAVLIIRKRAIQKSRDTFTINVGPPDLYATDINRGIITLLALPCKLPASILLLTMQSGFFPISFFDNKVDMHNSYINNKNKEAIQYE